MHQAKKSFLTALQIVAKSSSFGGKEAGVLRIYRRPGDKNVQVSDIGIINLQNIAKMTRPWRHTVTCKNMNLAVGSMTKN